MLHLDKEVEWPSLSNQQEHRPREAPSLSTIFDCDTKFRFVSRGKKGTAFKPKPLHLVEKNYTAQLESGVLLWHVLFDGAAVYECYPQ